MCICYFWYTIAYLLTISMRIFSLFCGQCGLFELCFWQIRSDLFPTGFRKRQLNQDQFDFVGCCCFLCWGLTLGRNFAKIHLYYFLAMQPTFQATYWSKNNNYVSFVFFLNICQYLFLLWSKIIICCIHTKCENIVHFVNEEGSEVFCC